MSGFISTVTSLVNAIFVGGTGEGASASWVSSVVACINANPILLIGFNKKKIRSNIHHTTEKIKHIIHPLSPPLLQ